MSNAQAVREAIERGLADLRAQRWPEAVAAFQDALATDPDHPEAHSLLGLALVRSGRREDGVRHLARAVELEPADTGLRFNLGDGLLVAGRPEDARRELLAVVEADPDLASAWVRLGDAAEASGDDARAMDAWAQAGAIDMTVHVAFKLAHTALRYGQLDTALKLASAGLAMHPREPLLLRLSCDIHAARRDWNALGQFARGWADAAPETSEPWRQLARAAFELGRHRDAVEAFARSLQFGRQSADDLAAFASVALHALDYEAAGAALEAAEELDAAHPEVHARRALLHMYFGRFDDAEAAARRCLERLPDHVPAYTILSRLRGGRLAEGDVERLEAVVADERVSLDRRIPAAFAVGHAHDAAEDVPLAMAAYERAHALALERDRLEGRRFDPAVEARFVERLIELFPAPVAPLEPQVAGPRPIFVVGAPRSGTTLVESVLGAHSRVQMGGERSAMRDLLRQYMAADSAGRLPDEPTLRAWAQAYLADLPPLVAKDHVTDKHPLNLAAVGLIARLFPNAAIVLVRRDAVETCLSMWRQELAKQLQFVHRFEDLAAFYAGQERLARHWETAFPGRVVSLRYEGFAGDFANAAPALVRAVGLEWEPQCLEFREAPQAIATFSTVDVRAPVAVRNRRVAAYGAYLDPLRGALKAAGVAV